MLIDEFKALFPHVKASKYSAVFDSLQRLTDKNEELLAELPKEKQVEVYLALTANNINNMYLMLVTINSLTKTDDNGSDKHKAVEL